MPSNKTTKVQYKVLRNGRKLFKTTFDNYERARQAARKWIRKHEGYWLWRVQGVSNPPLDIATIRIVRA